MHSDKASLSIMTVVTEEGDSMLATAHEMPRSQADLIAIRPRAVVHDISRAHVTCPTCRLRDLCLTEGLDAEALRELEAVVTDGIRLRKGETLFRTGDRFTALYAIRSGSCKTVSLSEDGNEQVAGYHMAGDIIGTDGIGNDVHGCQAVALEDTEVCALPFARIETLCRQNVAVPAQPAPAPVAGDHPRARDDAAAGHDACRAAPRRVPARPVAALPCARLLVRASSCCG